MNKSQLSLEGIFKGTISFHFFKVTKQKVETALMGLLWQ